MPADKASPGRPRERVNAEPAPEKAPEQGRKN